MMTRVLIAIAIGAVGMFLIDPLIGRGRRRRAMHALSPTRARKRADKAARRARRGVVKKFGRRRRKVTRHGFGSWLPGRSG